MKGITTGRVTVTAGATTIKAPNDAHEVGFDLTSQNKKPSRSLLGPTQLTRRWLPASARLCRQRLFNKGHLDGISAGLPGGRSPDG
jgi:hypothetical protein